MGILDWFRRKPEVDFESLLQQLSTAIQDKQQRLSEIKLRERRTSLVFTLYGFGSWLLYAVLWWLNVLPLGLIGFGGSQEDGEESSWEDGLGGVIVLALPAVVGPFGIMFIRRIVKMWYTRQETHEEKQLRDLRIKQRTTIEDIKKKTNYYTTKNLLERYDDGPGAGKGPQQQQPVPANPQEPSSLRRRAFPVPPDVRQRAISTPSSPAGSPSPAPRNQSNPSSPLAPGPLGGGTPHPPGSMVQQQQQQNPSTPFNNPQQQQFPSSPFAPQPIAPPTPPVKQWYDRLADAVLGEDPSTSRAGGNFSKFALVCEKCFAWNGLVEEKQWSEMQYICPKCSHFNPSPNSRLNPPNPSSISLPASTSSSSSSSLTRTPHQLAQSTTSTDLGEVETPVKTKKAAASKKGGNGKKKVVVVEEEEEEFEEAEEGMDVDEEGR
ncbi:hypothetical protein BDY24DRAFT_379153 [Mrakia frigida]|uniref:lunapark family zinc ribbon domain-containing protein n=1 Tax=Mrakia frigida TaxID=29902 RepID=UPI003FCBFF44